MDGFKGLDAERRKRDYKVMQNYEGSPSYQAYLRRKHLEELLAEAPRMKEAEVIEIIDSADFEELPAELRQALTDRMLHLALKPDTEKSGQKSGG